MRHQAASDHGCHAGRSYLENPCGTESVVRSPRDCPDLGQYNHQGIHTGHWQWGAQRSAGAEAYPAD